jgi:hypothetical protein
MASQNNPTAPTAAGAPNAAAAAPTPAAAAAVLNQLPIQQRIQLLLTAEYQSLLAAEQAKTQPLTATKFTPTELTALKAHLMDGGGVTDSRQLCTDFLNYLHDEKWTEFVQMMPHVIKAWMKEKGLVVPTKTGEGVMTTGAGPSHTSLIP